MHTIICSENVRDIGGNKKPKCFGQLPLGTGSQRHMAEKFKKTENSVVWCHRHTVFFAPTHPPVVQKTSLVNFKHKITTSANYTDGTGTVYTTHDK